MSCAHRRKWFYRSPFKRGPDGKPAVDLLERCQDCGALTRGDVTKSELEQRGLVVAMLDLDPWAKPAPAGRRR